MELIKLMDNIILAANSMLPLGTKHTDNKQSKQTMIR